MSNDDYDLWRELSGIRFMDGDFLSMIESLSLHFRSGRSRSGSCRSFTRITQGDIVRNILNGGGVSEPSIDLGIGGIQLTPDDLASDIDIFLESWIWILHEDDGSGYELELTFHGRLEEEPRCYYYNINYIEH